MYDIIYIGGGLNYAGAIVAAKAGKKVALIESDMSQLGGVCLHKGCIPSKMFLHYSNLVYESSNEILKGSLSLDMQTLVDKKNALLKSANKAVIKQCSHFELIEGEAKVVAPHKVEVNSEIYEGEYIVIGTGSSPFVPEGIEYNGDDIIISDDVLELTHIPKEIAIYGTGAIGLEMASFFATAGSSVTLIDRHDSLLKSAHPQIKEALKEQFLKLGVTLLTNHSIKSANTSFDGVEIFFEDGITLQSEMLLVATGRKPNVDVVDTKEIEVKRGITTNEMFETTLAKHYAIGDCNAKLQLAHAARAEALNVTGQILGNDPKALNLDNVVKFIHTLPMSYAIVGKGKNELEKDQISYKESLVPLNQFTYSAYNHAKHGLMISYVDEKSKKILGAEILAPNAEELIASVAMSLAGDMKFTQAKETILAHPTFSEALERTFYKLH